jgi:hypothetical protein
MRHTLQCSNAVIAFGLTAATLVALFLMLAVYCILDDFNLLGKLRDESDEDVGEAVRPDNSALPSRVDH